MRLYSVYIINDDGLCLYHQSFTVDAPPYSLITGLLIAMQNFVLEFTGTYPTDLSAGDFTFHMEKYGPLTVVLTTSNEKKPVPLLHQLGIRFLQQYGNKVEAWKGKVSEFSGFSEDVKDILGEHRIKKRVDPTEPITSLVLLGLDIDLQDVAKAMIEKREGDSEEIARMTNKTEYLARLQLEKLVELGHVGRIYESAEKIIYFIR